jgi:hypothetical protein
MHMHRSGTRKKDGASRRVCYKKVKRTDLGVTCTLYLLFNISQTNSFNGDQEEEEQ